MAETGESQISCGPSPQVPDDPMQEENPENGQVNTLHLSSKSKDLPVPQTKLLKSLEKEDKGIAVEINRQYDGTTKGQSEADSEKQEVVVKLVEKQEEMVAVVMDTSKPNDNKTGISFDSNLETKDESKVSDANVIDQPVRQGANTKSVSIDCPVPVDSAGASVKLVERYNINEQRDSNKDANENMELSAEKSMNDQNEESLDSGSNSDGMDMDSVSLDPLAMKVQRLDLGALLSDTDKEKLRLSGLLDLENSAAEISEVENPTSLKHLFSETQDSTLEEENLIDSEVNFAKVQKFNFGPLLMDINVESDTKLSSTAESLFAKSDKASSVLYGKDVIAAILKKTASHDLQHKSGPVVSGQDLVEDPRLTKSGPIENPHVTSQGSLHERLGDGKHDKLVKRKVNNKTFVKKV